MGGAYLDPEPTARLVKTYVNKFLQQICVGEGMSKFGVKAELQNRIIDSMSHPALSKICQTPSFRPFTAISSVCSSPVLQVLYLRAGIWYLEPHLRIRGRNTQTYVSAKLWNIQDYENMQQRAM